MLAKRSIHWMVLGAAISLGCYQEEPVRYPQQQGPYPQQQGPYPGQAPYAGGPPPGSQPGPQGSQPQQGVPVQQPPQQVPSAPVANDPINAADVGFLRNRASAILNELIAALASHHKQRVANIPLVVDDAPGEVNAFAGCTERGASFMAITDGMLAIEAYIAQAKATDEVFGTRKLDQYIDFMARNLRPKQPIPRPPGNLFDAAQSTDGRKVQRQHQLLDEQIAFVLGHELAHHYLGHLPCTATGVALTGSEINHAVTSLVPVLNSANEWSADVAGTYNVLDVGAKRQGYRLTENGGLLTMQFFGGFDRASPLELDFERTHPPPSGRVPVIQTAANGWRSGIRVPLQ
jgi:hypothetical protein